MECVSAEMISSDDTIVEPAPELIIETIPESIAESITEPTSDSNVSYFEAFWNNLLKFFGF